MRQFIKTFFAALLALIAGTVILFFIFIGIVSLAISSGSSKEVVLTTNTVLKISLDNELNERSSNNPLDMFDLKSMHARKQPGLQDIIACISKAAKDDKIKGIYIDLQQVQGGMAMLEELRNALLDFKKSKKFIYAYAESYSQGAYYIASTADKIYLNPQGMVELHGLMMETMFFKGTLDKLEVQPQLIRHGKFKSAGETYTNDKMSAENKIQVAAFVDNIWDNIASQVAASRKMTTTELKQIADSLLARNADDALKYNLVDKLAYYDQFTSDINALLGKKKDDKLVTITLNKYKNNANSVKTKYTADRIAVIYATGEIESGEGSDDKIGADDLAATIKKARTDENVKAIVLRVNSPGGSALASEIIWREIVLAANTKPLVASMSDVAASGGYYISCAANKIVAQPNTITGSIGVFGLVFNAQNLLRNKLGITIDGYKTGMYTDLGSMSRPLSPVELKIMQTEVDRVYDTFAHRVSDGRKIPVTLVDSLGQGRVWCGTDALKHHLVDTLGGLKDAIKIAAKMAGVEHYRIKELPEKKKAFQQIMEDLSDNAQIWIEEKELGEQGIYLKAMRSLLKAAGIQTRLEYEFNLH